MFGSKTKKESYTALEYKSAETINALVGIAIGIFIGLIIGARAF